MKHSNVTAREEAERGPTVHGFGGPALRVLALDTAARTQSVARMDGDRVVTIFGFSGDRGSSELILGLVERALSFPSNALDKDRMGEIDVIAVSRGPGSMTGLRVGIGAARGLAIGAGKRLIGVSTLQALAACVGGTTPVLSLIDAGRGEVYGALYAGAEVPVPLGDERVASPESFAAAVAGRRVRLAGSGAHRYHGLFPNAEWSPSASEEFLAAGVGRVAAALLKARKSDEMRAGDGGDRLDASPRYLRRDHNPVRFEA